MKLTMFLVLMVCLTVCVADEMVARKRAGSNSLAIQVPICFNGNFIFSGNSPYMSHKYINFSSAHIPALVDPTSLSLA